MLCRPPRGEEHHWKIISLSDTLLMLIPLLITSSPGTGGRLLVQSVLDPGSWETWVWHPKLLCETGQIIYPFVPHHPPPWTSCSMAYLIYIFMLFGTRGFLLVWVIHSLILLLRGKPWIQAEVSNQKVLMGGPSLWCPPCHYTLQVNADIFLS